MSRNITLELMIWHSSDVCGLISLTSDPPASPLPSQTYLEIFIYCLGFFIIVILAALAVICRLCCAPKKSDFNSQLAVQKLAKSIPLRRQVTCLFLFPLFPFFPFPVLSSTFCHCNSVVPKLFVAGTPLLPPELGAAPRHSLFIATFKVPSLIITGQNVKWWANWVLALKTFVIINNNRIIVMWT